jgi:hypothetical protein
MGLGAKGDPSPKAVTSPARGPVLHAVVGSMELASRAATTLVSMSDAWFLLRAILYACLLPPVAGVVSSTAGQFSSMVSAVSPLQQVASNNFGVWKQSS